MRNETITVSLPPGVDVRETYGQDVGYFEGEVQILVHPWDSNASRKLVWHIWRKRHPELEATNDSNSR